LARGRDDIWAGKTEVLVQGDSLRTWSFPSSAVQRAEVLLKTEGRPLNALVELWQGPDNTPQKMGVYLEDGAMRNFRCVLETPRDQNAICVRNTGQMEFPLSACVDVDVDPAVASKLDDDSIRGEIIQGGALKTYSFAPSAASVLVMLKTDGRPLNSRIELLQGPNNVKEVIELYTEDGLERPLLAILETPGSGNVVRILNTAPVEYPLKCHVEPFEEDAFQRDDSIVISDEMRGF
jgi:hypothetical protein